METQLEQKLKSFHYAFQITKKIVFEVNYYRLGNNKNKHFSTSAEEFNQRKTDYDCCGQCQKELLQGHAEALNFYTKYDPFHLLDLTQEKYDEMLADIEKLKEKYNFIESDKEIKFNEIKELSKQQDK